MPVSKPYRSVRRGEQGFTLVELLVALGVLGLAAGLLASALHGAARAGEGIDQSRPEQVRAEQVASVQRILRARIEHLTPVTRIDSARPVVEMRGEPDRLSFVAPPLDRMGPGAPQAFRLMTTPGGDLVLYSADRLDARVDVNDPSLVGWTSTRLLGGVRGFLVDYYGPGASGGTPGWQRLWLDRSAPPQLIRIRLDLAGSEGKEWPELVIQPQATLAARCAIDPLTGACAAS